MNKISKDNIRISDMAYLFTELRHQPKDVEKVISQLEELGVDPLFSRTFYHLEGRITMTMLNQFRRRPHK